MRQCETNLRLKMIERDSSPHMRYIYDVHDTFMRNMNLITAV